MIKALFLAFTEHFRRRLGTYRKCNERFTLEDSAASSRSLKSCGDARNGGAKCAIFRGVPQLTEHLLEVEDNRDHKPVCSSSCMDFFVVILPLQYPHLPIFLYLLHCRHRSHLLFSLRHLTTPSYHRPRGEAVHWSLGLALPLIQIRCYLRGFPE